MVREAVEEDERQAVATTAGSDFDWIGLGISF